MEIFQTYTTMGCQNLTPVYQLIATAAMRVNAFPPLPDMIKSQ